MSEESRVVVLRFARLFLVYWDGFRDLLDSLDDRNVPEEMAACSKFVVFCRIGTSRLPSVLLQQLLEITVRKDWKPFLILLQSDYVWESIHSTVN